VSVEVYVDVRAQLGEGPRWDAAANELLWVDIDAGDVYRGGDVVSSFDERVGAAALTDDGGLLVATASGLVLDGVRVASFPHGSDVRANDGACDEAGRFWIGTTALDFHDGGGALYRFDGELVPVLESVGLSNGLGWSPDGTRFYYIDSNTQRVDVFDYDGEISGRRPFAAIAPQHGTPDGLAIDHEGGVWVALYGGSCVRRYDEHGSLVHEIAIPGENVTACCFGGSSLYVTTAAPDGRVYVADVGVTGPSPHPFRRTAPSDAEPTSAR